MSDITLDSNVKELHLNSDNVNGVLLKDSSGSHKVWGHSYTFKWDWDSYLNTTSSTLTIPSKDFLYKPDNIIVWHNEASNSNSNAYMPHNNITLSRGTNNTVYYGDKLYYVQSSLTSDIIDPCINGILYYSANSYNNVKSDVTVNAMPVIKSDVSFLKCSLPSSLYSYFSSATLSYPQYGSSYASKSYTITSSTNNPVYIASNSTEGKIATCSWTFYSDTSGEWLGCKDDGNNYPLWYTLHTQIGFPNINKTCWDVPNPTSLKYTTKYISHLYSLISPQAYMYFNTIYNPSYSWEYTIQANVNFNATINWKRPSSVSNYNYYKVVIFGYQLQGSSNYYKYTPSLATNVFRFESSTIYHSSIANNTGQQVLSVSRTFYPMTQGENIYIIWRAGLIGSTTNSSDTSTWDWLDVYSNVRYDTIYNY